MQKIKISVNTDQVNEQTLKIHHVQKTCNAINEYLQANLSVKLTKEIALDVVFMAGTDTIKKYKEQQEKKLKTAGVSGAILNDILNTIQDLKADLEQFKQNLHRAGFNNYDPVQALEYLEFDSNGHALFSEENANRLMERLTIYAETKDHLEFYHAHQEAVKAVNRLVNEAKVKMPSLYFISPQIMFSNFFEINAKDEVKAKDINYKLF